MLYESKSRPWNALEVLAEIRPDSLAIAPTELEGMRDYLWKDMVSEYDAEHLCLMLESSPLTFSDEFIAFEKVWRRDEYNHFLGFRRIYSTFYRESETSITERLQQRQGDFSDVIGLLDDEFKLCLVMAYDELATTRAYNEDIPFYRSLGPEAFNVWVRNVKADEAVHYMNALRVAQVRYRDRFGEAASFLEEVLACDLSRRYKGTFILDHDDWPFTPTLLRECVATLLDALHRPPPAMGFY